MLRAFVFLSCCIFTISCKHATTTHLSQEKMKAVLTDIHLAESYSIVVNQDSAHQGSDKNYDSLAAYYQSIFKHHGISKTTFEQSLQWYKQNPAELDSVYTKMINGMPDLENKFNIRTP